MPNIKLLVISLLTCVFYLLKDLFYVPTTTIRLSHDYIKFIDEIKEEVGELLFYYVGKIDQSHQISPYFSPFLPQLRHSSPLIPPNFIPSQAYVCVNNLNYL